jgi:hypothetical protein
MRAAALKVAASASPFQAQATQRLDVADIPCTDASLMSPSVPREAVAGIRGTFGSLYKVCDGVSATGRVRLAATSTIPSDARYAIGWGKQLVDALRVGAAPEPVRVAPWPAPTPFPGGRPGKADVEPPMVVTPPPPPRTRTTTTTPPPAVAPHFPHVDELMNYAGVDIMTRSYYPNAPPLTRAQKRSAPPLTEQYDALGERPPFVPVPDVRAVDDLVVQIAGPDAKHLQKLREINGALASLSGTANDAMAIAWDLMDVFKTGAAEKRAAYVAMSNMQRVAARAARDARSTKQLRRDHGAGLQMTYNATAEAMLNLAQKVVANGAEKAGAPSTGSVLVRHPALFTAQEFFDGLTNGGDGLNLAFDIAEAFADMLISGDVSLADIDAGENVWRARRNAACEIPRRLIDAKLRVGDVNERDRAWMMVFIEEVERLAEAAFGRDGDTGAFSVVEAMAEMDRSAATFQAHFGVNGGGRSPATSPARRRHKPPTVQPGKDVPVGPTPSEEAGAGAGAAAAAQRGQTAADLWIRAHKFDIGKYRAFQDVARWLSHLSIPVLALVVTWFVLSVASVALVKGPMHADVVADKFDTPEFRARVAEAARGSLFGGAAPSTQGEHGIYTLAVALREHTGKAGRTDVIYADNGTIDLRAMENDIQERGDAALKVYDTQAEKANKTMAEIAELAGRYARSEKAADSAEANQILLERDMMRYERDTKTELPEWRDLLQAAQKETNAVYAEHALCAGYVNTMLKAVEAAASTRQPAIVEGDDGDDAVIAIGTGENSAEVALVHIADKRGYGGEVTKDEHVAQYVRHFAAREDLAHLSPSQAEDLATKMVDLSDQYTNCLVDLDADGAKRWTELTGTTDTSAWRSIRDYGIKVKMVSEGVQSAIGTAQDVLSALEKRYAAAMDAARLANEARDRFDGTIATHYMLNTVLPMLQRGPSDTTGVENATAILDNFANNFRALASVLGAGPFDQSTVQYLQASHEGFSAYVHWFHNRVGFGRIVSGEEFADMLVPIVGVWDELGNPNSVFASYMAFVWAQMHATLQIWPVLTFVFTVLTGAVWTVETRGVNQRAIAAQRRATNSVRLVVDTASGGRRRGAGDGAGGRVAFGNTDAGGATPVIEFAGATKRMVALWWAAADITFMYSSAVISFALVAGATPAVVATPLVSHVQAVLAGGALTTLLVGGIKWAGRGALSRISAEQAAGGGDTDNIVRLLSYVNFEQMQRLFGIILSPLTWRYRARRLEAATFVETFEAESETPAAAFVLRNVLWRFLVPTVMKEVVAGFESMALGEALRSGTLGFFFSDRFTTANSSAATDLVAPSAAYRRALRVVVKRGVGMWPSAPDYSGVLQALPEKAVVTLDPGSTEVRRVLQLVEGTTRANYQRILAKVAERSGVSEIAGAAAAGAGAAAGGGFSGIMAVAQQHLGAGSERRRQNGTTPLQRIIDDVFNNPANPSRPFSESMEALVDLVIQEGVMRGAL